MSLRLRDLIGDLVFTLPVAGQGTAGTPDEFTGMVAPFPFKVTGVRWIPKAAITANATNFFDLTVRNRKADASGTAVAATRSYAATNSTAFVAETVALSGTAANLEFAAGDVVTIEKLVSGTGLAMPAGTVQLLVQVR